MRQPTPETQPAIDAATADRERWQRAETLLEVAENLVTWAACVPGVDDPAIAEVVWGIRQARVRLQSKLNPLTIRELLQLPQDG